MKKICIGIPYDTNIKNFIMPLTLENIKILIYLKAEIYIDNDININKIDYEKIGAVFTDKKTIYDKCNFILTFNNIDDKLSTNNNIIITLVNTENIDKYCKTNYNIICYTKFLSNIIEKIYFNLIRNLFNKLKINFHKDMIITFLGYNNDIDFLIKGLVYYGVDINNIYLCTKYNNYIPNGIKHYIFNNINIKYLLHNSNLVISDKNNIENNFNKDLLIYLKKKNKYIELSNTNYENTNNIYKMNDLYYLCSRDISLLLSNILYNFFNKILVNNYDYNNSLTVYKGIYKII